MTIVAATVAPRGGLAETIGGASVPLLLRNAEIEKFEDKHRGIFETWQGFAGIAKMPTSIEVRDLIALGLVGGGMPAVEADRLLKTAGPDQLLAYYEIGRALIGAAFSPDVGAEDDGPADGAGKKKASRTSPKG